MICRKIKLEDEVPLKYISNQKHPTDSDEKTKRGKKINE
jgi:hypothetical protein